MDDNSVVVAVWKCSGVSDHIWATAAKIIMIIISLPHYISHYNYSGQRDNYNYLIIITQGNEIIIITITLLQRRKRGCIIIM